jgi:hypothetical protein
MVFSEGYALLVLLVGSLAVGPVRGKHMDHILINTRAAVGLAQHDGFSCCPKQNMSILAPRLASAMEVLLKLKSV